MALLYQSPTKSLPDGYTFCGAAMNDAPTVAHLLNQRYLKDTGMGDLCGENILREWQLPNFNPAMDVRMVLDRREALVGYIEVWITASHPWLWGCVHPDYEGRGIGTALLRWGEARVRFAIDNLTATPQAAPRFSALPVQRAHELCEALGWQQIHPKKAEIKHVTGALRLPGNTNHTMDVFEKTIN